MILPSLSIVICYSTILTQMLRHLKLKLLNIDGRQLLLLLALSIPIIFFCLEMLLTNNLLPAGDADYLMQTVLAARISILEHGQFPWWNPWVSGGVPLFANPQFGLISLPTILGLAFGAVIGYKLAILAYFFLGFYGFLLLLRRGLNTPLATAILLAYVWTFGTFLTYRSLGHYTFLTIQFFPLIIYFYLARQRTRLSWLYLGIIAGLAALSAAHNITIMGYLLMAMLIATDVLALKFDNLRGFLRLQISVVKADLVFLIKAAAVFLAVTLYRLIFTLDYLGDYPRSQIDNPEPTLGVFKGLFAIAGPLKQFNTPPQHPQWSWMEASAYIGLFTCIAACLVMLVVWQSRKTQWRKLFSYNPLKILIIGLVCFVLGMGNFIESLSPYSLMRHLPVLSSMRVASRWLVFCSLLTIIFIGIYKGSRYRAVINGLLAISIIELFLISRPQLARPYMFPSQNEAGAHSFQQKKHYNTKRGGIAYDENLTDATQNNYGQIIAGDSLIDTRPGTPYQIVSGRCPVDEGCDFVLTNNAKLAHWSPNRIKLERTAPGDILLNMNPGSCWLVNDVYQFRKVRVVEPALEFRISDSADFISVECRPRYSVEWLINKIL